MRVVKASDAGPELRGMRLTPCWTPCSGFSIVDFVWASAIAASPGVAPQVHVSSALHAGLCRKGTKKKPGLQKLRAGAQVIDFELQRQLAPHMRDMQPLPGVFDPDFIAANQGARADHLVKGSKQVWGLTRSRLGAVEWDSSGPWTPCHVCCAFL